MGWLAVNKLGAGYIFHNKPVRKEADTKYGYWVDTKTYDEIRRMTTNASDYAVYVSEETVYKLAGKKMNYEDEPLKV